MKRSIKGFVFDLDGTLVLSDRSLGSYQILPGAIETLSDLNERGVPFVVLTNGSAYAPARHAAKLRAAGLPIDDERMLTPSSVAAALFTRCALRRVLVLGERGVGHALHDAGIATLYPEDIGSAGQASERFDAVYVGWHPKCSMQDIEAAAHAIWNGAQLFTASDVPFFATREGRTVGYSYAIIGAIRRLTRARVTLVGKPSLHAMRHAAKRLQLPIRDIAVVGDDPLVEILMARRAEAFSFGVTTGMTCREAWQKQPANMRPDVVVDDVREVVKELG